PLAAEQRRDCLAGLERAARREVVRDGGLDEVRALLLELDASLVGAGDAALGLRPRVLDRLRERRTRSRPERARVHVDLLRGVDRSVERGEDGLAVGV